MLALQLTKKKKSTGTVCEGHKAATESFSLCDGRREQMGNVKG